MKRPLLLAALIATTGLVGSAAKANEPLHMFNIQTPGAGMVNFSGTGTANFNQSLGTSNSFNVGSSTNLGVNASASSTEDYTAVGSAELDLAGTSRLQQTIGTATSAFNSSTVAEASARSADVSATEVANRSSYGESWSSTWNENYIAESGYTEMTGAEATAAGFDKGAGYYNEKAGREAANAEHGMAYDSSSTTYADQAAWEAAWNSTFTETATSSENFVSEENWTAFSQDQWQSGWEDVYSDTYKTSFETATVNANLAVSQTDDQGVIKGSFTTTESGSADAALEAMASSLQSGAEAAAKAIVGTGSGTNATADYANLTASEWEAAYEQEYQQAFASAYSTASGAIERKSVSNVDVAGIGVIADVNAAATSKFTSTAQLIEGATRDGNGNGNASAGANLATSSYANQNNATTANAFMQAFSGGLPEAKGVETIVNISDNSNGTFNVVTDKVTTARVTTQYDVANDGTATNGAVQSTQYID